LESWNRITIFEWVVEEQMRMVKTKIGQAQARGCSDRYFLSLGLAGCKTNMGGGKKKELGASYELEGKRKSELEGARGAPGYTCRKEETGN